MGHPVFARFYARTSQAMERGISRYREELLSGLTGHVIEIGAGNGMNFTHYPDTVTDVMAIEPEPHLRELAHEAAQRSPVPVEVVDGTADRLPTDDQAIDVAVFSLVLCTVPDPATALAEAVRVLRPNGEIRFFEHVRANNPVTFAAQRLLERTVFPACCGGCHPARDTKKAIEDAGFTIGKLRELGFSDTQMPFPASPQILGTGRRPVPEA